MKDEMATPDVPSDATLVRYLLGTLPPEDEEGFDELSIVDSQFPDRLRAIEHDLADAYARGELSRSDRARWEQRFLASPQGQDGVRLAEALVAREGREAGRRPSFRWTWELAAAAILALATGAGYLAIRHQVATPAPSVATVAPENRPAAQPAPAEKPGVAAVGPRFVALTLAPALRSVAEPPRLVVPSGTTEVRLTLQLEPNQYSRFDVSIGDASSRRDVWRATDVDALRTADGKVLNTVVPAAALPASRCLVTVRAGPQREIVASYPLTIVLE
jgi:hypothetical protein